MTPKHTQRLTLFLNPEVLMQARAQAVIETSSLTGLVEKALLQYLPDKTIIKKAKIRMSHHPIN